MAAPWHRVRPPPLPPPQPFDDAEESLNTRLLRTEAWARHWAAWWTRYGAKVELLIVAVGFILAGVAALVAQRLLTLLL